ncbi:response regulator [Deinococcus pimensis]|uniref:response regulator n=1 Tax=Deinococcus pimensis TaxID=309888 RepID=UPI0004B2E054|nr:response regulator [Deinococcus pimensis]
MFHISTNADRTAVPEDVRPRPRHVLVIDDHALDVELACLALSECAPDAQVTFVLDPFDALAHLRHERGPTPDLVLLDVHMPGLDGFEVLRELRAHPRTRELRVVMCSTSARPEDQRAARALGVEAYLVKPVTLPDLQEALTTVLASLLN